MNPFPRALNACIALTCVGLFTSIATADVNVLIIGCSKDSGERHTQTNSTRPAFIAKSKAFSPTAIGTQLQSILAQDNRGAVNVTVLDRYATDTMSNGWQAYSYNLASWFHYPFPAGAETARWANLRGEGGVQWDYVVLIGDPYTMEYTPGVYAHGVAKIAEEVAKGSAQLILLMPWPGSGSTSSVNHYKEVVYRTARSGGIKVAPAALAWQACGSPSGTSHPTTAGAYIAAASIYSSIYNQSAKASAYVYNDANADTTFNTYTTNNSAVHYTGNFSFQNPYLMMADTRRKIYISERGTSTEQYFKSALNTACSRAKIGYDTSYSDKYSSNTPEDDGLGWPNTTTMPIAFNMGRDGLVSEDFKSYVVNPAYWQLGFGFYYQDNTWSYPVDQANDLHIGQMQMNDNDLANRMLNEKPTARNLPVRTLWAQIHQQFPTLNPLNDGSGPHLNLDESEAAGCYMFTLYSGRCPLDPKPATPDVTWEARKIGYETAWRVGRCQTRAPGFKVMPSAYNKLSISQNSSETMSVQFILPPKNDVTVNVTVSSATAAIVGSKQLLFTPTNYDQAQNVVITGLPGATGAETFNVVFTTSSTDEVYNGLQDSWEYTTTRSAQTLTNATVAGNSASTYKNMTVTIPINVAGATSTNTLLAGPSNGTLTWSGSSVVYTPDPDYYGTDGFAYAVNANGTLTTGYTTITVINAIPDGLITVTTSDASASETGADTGTWTFTRTGSTAATKQVFYTLSGTAASGSDFTALAASVTFPIGASTVTRTLTPINDLEYEGAETVTLTVTPNAGYLVASAPNNAGTITILDDDKPTITVAATDTVCAEASTADVGVFTLTRSGINTATQTVNYTLSGQALNGTDYTSLTGSVTFAANSSTATVTITPTNDTAYEGPEDVTLSISADAAYLVGSPDSATLTIADNDKPTVSVVSSISSTTEGGEVPILTFSRTGNTGLAPLTLFYAIAGSASNGGDYNALSGSITIPLNQASASLPIAVFQDDITEAPETLTITISTNTEYAVAGSPANAATLTILDDNEAVAVNISATDNAASEPAKGDGTGTFTITRSGSSSAAVTVNYAVSGAATEGSDFASLPGTVTIPAGQTSATVTITALDDSEVEPDESVVLTLQAGTGYSVGTTSSATGSIYDDEATQVRVEPNDTTCLEAATANNGSFTLRRLGNRSAAITVNATISGTATNGTDYTALPATFTISANGGSANINVVPINDSLVEGTETVTLTLNAGTGYTVNAQNSATLEIRDDEVIDVNLTTVDTDCAEQASPGTGSFRISRTATAATSLTVTYALSGTATNGADYTTLSGTATIPANATSVDVVVTPINDGIVEGSESVTMTLTGAGASYDIGDNRSQTFWIKDDESPWITLTASDATAAEADGGTTNPGQFTFTSNIAPAGNLTINYTVSSNNGIDCVPLPGSIVLPAGQTSVTLPVIPIDDELAEGAENVGVTLTNATTYSLVTTGAVNVSIAASDSPTATVNAFDPGAIENPVKTGRFLVTLNKIVGSNTAVGYSVSGTATSGADYTALSGSVTVGAGGNTAVITVTPLDDAIIDGPESVVVTLSTSASYTIGSPSSASVVIADDEAPATALDTWKQTAFGADWTTPAIAGNASDYDQDGLANLLEYAIGSDPLTSTPAGQRVQSSLSTGYLKLSFSRETTHDDITIIVQAADDLSGTWTNVASSINGSAFSALVAGVTVSESGTGSTRSVSVTDLYPKNDPSHRRRFMRIMVGP